MKKAFKKIFTVVISFVIVFSAFVPAVYAAGNEIKEVNITLPIPKNGDEIYGHESITVEETACRLGLIAWFSEFAGIQEVAQTEIFVPLCSYELCLTIYTDSEDCVFADDCVVKVNGEEIKVYYNEKDYLVVGVDFGKLEGDEISLEIILESVRDLLSKIEERISSVFREVIIY